MNEVATHGEGLRGQTPAAAGTTNFIWDGQEKGKRWGEIVVDEKGLEPSTSSVRGRRSPN